MNRTETSPHHFEHEAVVVTSGGTFTASELELVRRGAQTGEAVKISTKEPEPELFCPLRGNLSIRCKREKCALFSGDRCAASAPHSGKDKTTGRWCPVCNMLCSERCALNRGGVCGGADGE